MSILDCHGQEKAILRLQRAFRGKRLPHSYIFHGPEGVGKTLLARQWAKLLLCCEPLRLPFGPSRCRADAPASEEEIDDCCDRCHDCRFVDKEIHPDLHIINKDLVRFTKQTRSSQMLALPIDVIREFVIDRAGLSPSRGRARIFIIEEAQTMNRSAQNAMLKTLEEPPPNTFLLLVTTQPDLLVPTVRSRCQAVRFLPLATDFVREHLTGSGVSDEQARYWADFSAGRLGPAIQLAQMNLYEKKCRLIEQLAKLNYLSVLEMADWIVRQAGEFAKHYLKLYQDRSVSDATRQGQSYFLQMLSHAFRLALRCRTNDPTASEMPDQHQILAQIARKFSPIACAQAIRATAQTENLIRANVNPSLLFESLMLKYIDCASFR